MDQLIPLVYEELRAIAHRQRRGEDADATFNTTSLVHEAYIKLIDQTRVEWQNRAHFFAIASQSIRRIIVDRARERLAKKRGGGWVRVPIERLNEGGEFTDERAAAFVALDEALDRLESLDLRQCQVVTYRFFGGLTIEETADAMDISIATVKRDWRMGRAWLHKELTDSHGESGTGRAP